MSEPSPQKLEQINRAMRFLIIPVFLISAVAFWFGPKSVPIPLPPAVEVSAAQFSPEPKREILGDPPMAFVNGFDRTCNDCHRIIDTGPAPRKNLLQHTDIQLQHGLNDGCLNCHDKEDRDKLVLRGGRTIPFTQTQLLCQQCHGPTYRDWQRGMHGKTLGRWDERRGPLRRLLCTECHDPHAPAFEAFEPLPGPNTLRMGDPAQAHHPAPGEGKHNPLRTWSQPDHSSSESYDTHTTSSQGDH
jgi:hypothetical protein